MRNILDYIDDETLDLAPEFQRRRVWDNRRKSRLIESILPQIPLPAFYFAEDRDGGLRVVDGVQRLSTVYDFVRGDHFKLTGLEYLTDEANKGFAELPVRWQRRIDNTQIVVNVIDPRTPLPVMYEIFRRINTGGVPLNPQEIRHCMSGERSRRFLRRCVDSREFRAATQDKHRDHIRMMDLELALRFCAFRVNRR